MTAFVHVERWLFERSTSGSISAGLWFSFGPTAFPEERWEDFATAILAALVEAVQRLLEGSSETEEVFLMEGPYRLEMQVEDEAHVTISAICNRGKLVVEHEQIFETVALAVDLCAAAEQLLSWCRPVGWIGRDEVQLEQGVTKLLATIAKRAN
jgi:hypothetical protein